MAGSSAQPRPGSHARTGSTLPNRIDPPDRLTRSRTGPATFTNAASWTVTVEPAGTDSVSATRSVVGSGVDHDRTCGPDTDVTRIPVPTSRSRGALAHSRKTT